MDGAIVLKAALEALAGAGVKTAIGLAKSIWDWIEDRVKKSPDARAREAWANFQRSPNAPRDALLHALGSVSASDVAILSGYVSGMAAMAAGEDDGFLTELLMSYLYIPSQLERFVRVIFPLATDRIPNPSQDDNAAYLVRRTRAQMELRPKLIQLMIAANPQVMQNIAQKLYP